MTRNDVDVFCGKLDKAFTKFVKKHAHLIPPTQPHPQESRAEDDQQDRGRGAEEGSALQDGVEGLEEGHDEEDQELLSAMTQELHLSN